MRSKIIVEKDKIPYQFQIVLGGKKFSLEWQYNKKSDRFTCTLYDAQGSPIVYGEPLIYGNPLFSFLPHQDPFPVLTIIPIDESGQGHEVTWENFGETVFLTIDDEERSE